jgi:hypothetical protein
VRRRASGGTGEGFGLRRRELREVAMALTFVPEYDFYRPLGHLAGGWRVEHQVFVPGSIARVAPPEFRHLALFPERFQRATEDQLQTNSCTANAVIALQEYLFQMQKGFWQDFSRPFTYWTGRSYRGMQNNDGGAIIGDVIQATGEFGICTDPIWQFDPALINTKPSEAAFRQAKRYKMVNPRRIPREAVLEVLSGGGDPDKARPVVGGFIVHQREFFGPTVLQTGEIVLPTSSSSYGGWHAMLIAGYSTDWIEGPNSWGSNWASQSVTGHAGWYRMDIGYLRSQQYSMDFCTGDLVEVPEGVQ